MSDLQQVEGFVKRAEKEMAAAVAAEEKARKEISEKGATPVRIEALSTAQLHRETLEDVLADARRQEEQLRTAEQSKRLDDLVQQVRDANADLHRTAQELADEAQALVVDRLCPKIRERFDAKHVAAHELRRECQRVAKQIHRNVNAGVTAPPVREQIGNAIYAALMDDARRLADERRNEKEQANG
jgi:hypothetical protein